MVSDGAWEFIFGYLEQGLTCAARTSTPQLLPSVARSEKAQEKHNSQPDCAGTLVSKYIAMFTISIHLLSLGEPPLIAWHHIRDVCLEDALASILNTTSCSQQECS